MFPRVPGIHQHDTARQNPWNGGWFTWLVRGAALAGVLIASYLAFATLSGKSVAGCGDSVETGCGRVLASRWATWLGVPVGLPAVLVYLGALASTWMLGSGTSATATRLGWALFTVTATLAGGAAIWFLGLQLMSVGDVCWYCLALHSCGLLLAVLACCFLPSLLVKERDVLPAVLKASGVGAAGVVALILGQLMVPPAVPGMEITEVSASAQSPPAADSPSPVEPALPVEPAPAVEPAPMVEPAAPVETRPAPATSVPALTPPAAPVAPPKTSESSAPPETKRVADHSWQHRQLSLLDGAASLDIYDYPVLGDREALAPLVEVFDYTCPHCRELFGMLRVVEERYPEQLALVLIPMPMNKNCNRFVQSDHEKHATACELTRLAIAVWQAKPSAFEAFHTWLMDGETPPSPAEAQTRAEAMLGAAAMNRALQDPAVDAQLQENCRLYAVIKDSTNSGTIPKLIYGKIVVTGVPGSEAELRSFLESQLGLVPRE